MSDPIPSFDFLAAAKIIALRHHSGGAPTDNPFARVEQLLTGVIYMQIASMEFAAARDLTHPDEAAVAVLMALDRLPEDMDDLNDRVQILTAHVARRVALRAKILGEEG